MYNIKKTLEPHISKFQVDWNRSGLALFENLYLRKFE